jgi:hypothetical protein
VRNKESVVANIRAIIRDATADIIQVPEGLLALKRASIYESIYHMYQATERHMSWWCGQHESFIRHVIKMSPVVATHRATAIGRVPGMDPD